jgi:hypothetical protein
VLRQNVPTNGLEHVSPQLAHFLHRYLLILLQQLALPPVPSILLLTVAPYLASSIDTDHAQFQ